MRLGRFPVDLPGLGDGDLVAAVDTYAGQLRDFYHSRATWHRRFYRTSGALIILAGAGLPVLANLEYNGRNVVVSLVGTLVAVLAAMHGFYRWDQSWILLRNTEITLTTAYWDWRLAVAVPGVTSEATRERTAEFLNILGEIRNDEASTYFKNLAFPSATTPQVGPR